MAGSLAVPDRVKMRDELGRSDVSLTGEYPERGRLCLDVISDGEVELGSVAGGQRNRFMDVVGRDELSQHGGCSTLRQGDALAQLHRRGLVGDSEREQLTHRRASAPFSLPASTASSVASCCSEET